MTVFTVAGKRLVIHDREEWQTAAEPVRGPDPFPELVHWFVVHWPGAADTWKPDTDVAAHLRRSHHDYLVNKGFSYGYGFVIGPNRIDWSADPVATDIWEVRGFDIRIASNDGDNGEFGKMANPNFNGRSISAQIMASGNSPATPDQLLQARYLVALADVRYGERLEVIPHRTSDATTCPGEFLTSMIPHIATRPTTPPPSPPEEPPMSDEDVARIADAVYARLTDPTADGATIGEHVARTKIRTTDPNGVVGDHNLASVIGWTWNELRESGPS